MTAVSCSVYGWRPAPCVVTRFPLNREKESCPDTIFLPVSRTGTAARKGAPKCHYTTMVKGGLVLLKIVNGVKSGLLLEAHFRNDRIFYCVKKKPLLLLLFVHLTYSQPVSVQTVFSAVPISGHRLLSVY